MAIRLKTSTLANMKGNSLLLGRLTRDNELNTVETIRRWMRQNKVNGPLTSIANLKIISDAINVSEAKLVEEVNNETNSKRVPDPDTALSGPFS